MSDNENDKPQGPRRGNESAERARRAAAREPEPEPSPPEEALEEPIDEPEPDAPRAIEGLSRSASLSRLTRYSYLAGVAGSITILTMGYLAMRKNALTQGWGILASSDEGRVDQNLSIAFALAVCAALMFGVELVVRLRVDRGRVLSVAEHLREGRIGRFVGECISVYLVELGMLWLAFAFYRTAGEYGFARGNGYYRPWFSVMPYFWGLYVYGGLPYILFTRALQHDPRADRKQAAFTVMKAARLLAFRLGFRGSEPPKELDRFDRSAILGLFVKLFFVPVMTVFFADQFSHLVRNWGYVVNTVLGEPGAKVAVLDFYHVSFTVIFSIDVGLAWCGYVLSSRWIKNTLFSTEPTALGWIVALLSYPPINRTFGYYFSTPDENGFLSMASKPAVTFLATCSVLSFCIYTSATVCFGLRFSNLTHRGIITTGPYAYVRHPAYAAKNFSWWCVMFPYALYEAGAKHSAAGLIQVIGLVVMTGMYTARALTEERHLGRDPEYRAYMKKVPYRFIPGLV